MSDDAVESNNTGPTLAARAVFASPRAARLPSIPKPTMGARRPPPIAQALMKLLSPSVSMGLLSVALVIAASTQTAAQEYTFTTLAGLAVSSGSDDGTDSDARFYNPYAVAVDSAGKVYVADSGNNTIRKMTLGGMVTTLAGLAGSSGSADGTGSAARFYQPYGVAVDSAGNVFVADGKNNTIRKITSAGVVTTLAGLAGIPGE
jgi:streptogramin lyase